MICFRATSVLLVMVASLMACSRSSWAQAPMAVEDYLKPFLPPPPKLPDPKDELTALKVERYQEAREAYRFWLPVFFEHAVDMKTVVDAADDVIESQLQLAATDEDRILALEARVQMREELTRHMRRRAEGGEGMPAELYTAKASLLSAKIALLEAMQVQQKKEQASSAAVAPPTAAPATPQAAIAPTPCVAPVTWEHRGLRRRR